MKLVRLFGWDAAAVAVAWFLAFSQEVPTSWRWLAVVGLAVAVVGIYSLDRMWDQGRLGCAVKFLMKPGTRRVLATLLVAAGAVMIAISLIGGWHLPLGRTIAWGLGCASGVGLYYAKRLAAPDWKHGRAGVVAALFWCGVAGPTLAWLGRWPQIEEVGFFALLWLNARLCLCSIVELDQSGFRLRQLALTLGAVLCWSHPAPNHIPLAHGSIVAACALGVLPWAQHLHRRRGMIADLILLVPPLLAAWWP